MPSTSCRTYPKYIFQSYRAGLVEPGVLLQPRRRTQQAEQPLRCDRGLQARHRHGPQVREGLRAHGARLLERGPPQGGRRVLRGGPQTGAGQRELQDEPGPGQREVRRASHRQAGLPGRDDGRARRNGPQRAPGQPGAHEYGHIYVVGPQHAEHDGTAHVGRNVFRKQHGGITTGVSKINYLQK